MIAACGAFALTGFPLDDLWHRLFGQDVTLWGPTHLMLIGGGSLATLGAMALTTEALAAKRGQDEPASRRWSSGSGGRSWSAASSWRYPPSRASSTSACPSSGSCCTRRSMMLAAGIGLVTARIYLGRGGALLAVAGFLVIRGFLALTVGVVFGQTTPHFPLYIVEALLVELVFLRATRLRPVAAGALAGVAIGTIGLGAEWGWSHVWMPIPWPSSLLPEAAVAGLRGRRGRRCRGRLRGRRAGAAAPLPAAARRAPGRARGRRGAAGGDRLGGCRSPPTAPHRAA